MAEVPALPFLDLEAQRLRSENGLAVLVTDRKVQNEPNGMEKVQNHTEIFQQKIELRQRRVGELREIGLKVDQIQERLAEEGQFWSIRTIKDDLKSRTAEERREELERAQSADISRCDDVKVRLEFRDRKIERLTARKSPEVQVNLQNKIEVERASEKMMIDLSQMSKDDREAVLRAEEALTRAERAAGSQ